MEAGAGYGGGWGQACGVGPMCIREKEEKAGGRPGVTLSDSMRPVTFSCG